MRSPTELLQFNPTKLAFNGHIQTILATFGRKKPYIVPSTTEIIQLEDGDKIACEVSQPPEWQPHHPLLLLVHGLGGSADSKYMLRMAYRAHNQGHATVRINLRGCGSGIKLAKRAYHAGQSRDVLHVIQHFNKLFPKAPITLLGYSLGGNVNLKLAGEEGSHLKDLIQKIVVVSPPFNIPIAVNKIMESRFRFYERHFIRMLSNDYNRWRLANPHLNKPPVPKHIHTLSGFDDFHTVPSWGFENAQHYYYSSSCCYKVPFIRVSTHILCANDDPVSDTETVGSLRLPPSVQVYRSIKGGHMGFLGSPLPNKNYRWLDTKLSQFIINN